MSRQASFGGEPAEAFHPGLPSRRRDQADSLVAIVAIRKRPTDVMEFRPTSHGGADGPWRGTDGPRPAMIGIVSGVFRTLPPPDHRNTMIDTRTARWSARTRTPLR